METLQQILGYTATQNECWFGWFIGSCTYKVLGDAIFLSLGDALAASGLLLTAYQLKTDKWRIVLNIRPKWQSYLSLAVLVLGLICSLFAALVRTVPIFAMPPPLYYPLFWEVVAFLCFIAAPVLMLAFATRYKYLFNRHTARKFYAVMLEAVNHEHLIKPCIDILHVNLGEITKALDSLRLTKRNEPLNENETYASYAHAIVSVIFTEDRVSQYIVNSRLYFLLSFWDKLAEYQIDPRVAKRTTDHLLDALYNDHNSYFYRQRSENGVSLAVNIYEVIFTNPYLLAKRGLLNPPSTLFRKYEQLDSEYLSVFLKALSDSISTYWQEMCNPEIKQEIVRALEKLGKYSETLARATQDPTNGKEPFEQLSLISSFLQYEYLQLYVIAKRDKLMISEEEISVSTDASSGKSINYAYVEAIYAFLAALSYAKEEGDFLIKTAARNVVDGLFTPVVSETHIKILKERCIQLIWEKIMGEGEQNVRSMTPNIKGYFPVVARTYLDAVLSKHRPSSNTIIEERKKLTAFLYESLKPKLKEKMQDDVSLFEDQFLPKSIVFNETTNKFEHKLWGGKTEEI